MEIKKLMIDNNSTVTISKVDDNRLSFEESNAILLKRGLIEGL